MATYWIRRELWLVTDWLLVEGRKFDEKTTDNKAIFHFRAMLESFADRLHEQMGKSSSCTDYKFEARPEVVANTTVPIIRTKFLGGIPLHISLPRNDPQSLRNTIMIKHYVAACSFSFCCFLKLSNNSALFDSIVEEDASLLSTIIAHIGLKSIIFKFAPASCLQHFVLFLE